MSTRRRLVRVAGVRSTATGLVGNTLNVDSLTWERFDASIGAGADSFYEYMLKVGPRGFLHGPVVTVPSVVHNPSSVVAVHK